MLSFLNTMKRVWCIFLLWVNGAQAEEKWACAYPAIVLMASFLFHLSTVCPPVPSPHRAISADLRISWLDYNGSTRNVPYTSIYRSIIFLILLPMSFKIFTIFWIRKKEKTFKNVNYLFNTNPLCCKKRIFKEFCKLTKPSSVYCLSERKRSALTLLSFTSGIFLNLPLPTAKLYIF